MTSHDNTPRFAAFLDLRDKRAVVAGAGAVAAHKAETLLRSGARVIVVAPDACVRVSELAAQGRIAYEARRFRDGDLDGADIAVAATDDRAVTVAVAAAARARRILVNVADDATLSSFVMAALVERAPLQIAISTGGASPVLARRIAATIEAAVPAAFGRLAALAADFRAEVRRRLPDVASRRRFWERVLDGPVAATLLAGDEASARQLLETELKGTQSMTTRYAFGKTVRTSYEDTLAAATAALATEGFGVLTEIDVAATLKKKLGKDMPPYKILGACNPQLAHRAIDAEPQIGTLLPCNVVVRVGGDGRTIVEIMDPRAVLQLVDRPEIAPIAAEVREKLERVLAAL